MNSQSLIELMVFQWTKFTKNYSFILGLNQMVDFLSFHFFLGDLNVHPIPSHFILQVLPKIELSQPINVDNKKLHHDSIVRMSIYNSSYRGSC